MKLKVFLDDKETNNPLLVLFVKDLIRYEKFKSEIEEKVKKLKAKYSIPPEECIIESLFCEAYFLTNKDMLIIIVTYKVMNSSKSIEEVVYKEEYNLSNNLIWHIIKNIIEINIKTGLMDIEKL